jgi:hypothetical protein
MALIKVTCPCCEATLHIDLKTEAVIRYEEHVKPPSIADMEQAVQRFKGEAGKREDAFQKSVNENKNRADILNKKFDELLKVAKETPDAPAPKRPFDAD